MLTAQLAAVVLAFAPGAFAQLSTFRGTIEGALHQCENTSMNFFDSGATRPLDVLFLPHASVPAALLTGTTTLAAALRVGPLFAIEGITTPDAGAYPFILQLAAGDVVEVSFAPIPDGTLGVAELTCGGGMLSATRHIGVRVPPRWHRQEPQPPKDDHDAPSVRNELPRQRCKVVSPSPILPRAQPLSVDPIADPLMPPHA